ncbi:glycosyltransferase family 4 protein [Clostridium sp. YIM B02515]|uniref:Glycosyltransferase family 4 protein n=1 Tax=Clostridium rhizosphaerae TaxID=2803861 RepID=A0ABS1TCY5_9CLOT|nr:glycosyltransferase family 1 protein [Clostridium rhizosphaerae]MBL4935843.1 glycosyltransferase family 4 protein [Clostridium rhizosphaerae]
MKVGIDGRAAKWYRGTGIGTYAYQLISSLNAIDALNEYLLFMPESSNMDISFKKNFLIRNISEGNKSNFWDEVNIPNILTDKDIELYHVPQNGVGLPKEKKCPFIITLHDVIPLRMPETVGETYLKIFQEEMPDIVSFCDGIITVSQFSKEDIAKAFNYPLEKIHVTHLAAENIYTPLDKDICSALIKQYYGIEGDYILYVGGFSPRKNIVGLIEAFSKLKEKFKKDIKLVIAGKQGKSYNIYKNRAISLGVEDSVIFPGFIQIEHLPYLYNASKLVVYPSFYEGFGLPPVEAMACGVPVITSNVTSIPEVLGDSAVFINPYDVDELCSSMFSVLMDDKLQEKLIIKGLVRSSELSWDKTAKDTLIAYNKTINN